MKSIFNETGWSPNSFMWDTTHLERIPDIMLQSIKPTTNYPPYNIKVNDTKYIIEIGVAGFSKNQLEINLKNNILSVKGFDNGVSASTEKWLYHGLATRDFHRKFTVADSMEIIKADLVNGVLRIYLELVTEIDKGKTIPINTETEQYSDTSQLLNENENYGDQEIHRGGLEP